MNNDIEISVAFDKDHPTLEGHFPNNPLIPGVVILNQVIKVAEKVWPRQSTEVAYQVVSCKFLQPLVPPATMTIHVQKIQDNKIKFTTRHGAIDLSSGIIELI